MKSADVQVGQTYTVKIPERLPDDHFLSGKGLFEGSEFEGSVLAEPESGLVRVSRTTWPGALVDVILTLDQKHQLGLPVNGEYVVNGILYDEAGNPVDVSIPQLDELVVPVRWLRQST